LIWTMSLDWICYVVSGVYATLFIGCLIGLKINFTKKKALKASGVYAKNKRVIRWKAQFFWLLFFATIVRITAIIAATVESKKLLISSPDSETEFLWQIAASFGSLLYFTAFMLIIWFFSQIIFYQRDSKQLVTTTVIVVNVILYSVSITLGIADFINHEWNLIYDVALPLFSVSNIVLAICFVVLSCKIAQSLQSERKETIDYHIEQSQSSRYQRQIRAPQPAPNKPAGDTAHIVPRLVKLSVLCATMWTIRGGFTLALRIWPDASLKPKPFSSLQWESLFYCITEYPPSLGALLLMILKPKKDASNNLIQHEPEQGLYPSAVDYPQ